MSDQIDPDDLFAYYDREADIVWVPLGFSNDAMSEETEWGLIDRDADTDRVVGIEIRDASGRLPADLLAVIPPPAPPRDDSD
jgi:uncharacterized protein YuzE